MLGNFETVAAKSYPSTVDLMWLTYSQVNIFKKVGSYIVSY